MKTEIKQHTLKSLILVSTRTRRRRKSELKYVFCMISHFSACTQEEGPGVKFREAQSR